MRITNPEIKFKKVAQRDQDNREMRSTIIKVGVEEFAHRVGRSRVTFNHCIISQRQPASVKPPIKSPNYKFLGISS